MKNSCQNLSPHINANIISETAPQADSEAASGVTRLLLNNFRSYKSFTLSCSSKPMVITGPNGSGKTNILEALSFLSPGRGFRQAKLTDVLRRAENSQDTVSISNENYTNTWAVSCTFTTPYGDLDLGTGLTITPGESEKRRVRIQKEDVKSQTSLGDYVSIHWLTPQMDRIFVDGVTARRRFLDRLVYNLDPSHAGRVMRYEHVMRERLKILKTGGIHQDRWLSTLEIKMAESGVSIAVAREQTIQSLMQSKSQALGVFPKAILAMDGYTESRLKTASALDVEDELKKSLRQSRRQDAESGRTNVGPHRSELSVLYAEKNQFAEQCSTGEQKALLISIIMAAARLQSLKGDQVPLLLLDEVVAHLDHNRRDCLFEEIMNLGIQAWMTGTDKAVFQGIFPHAQHLHYNGQQFETLSR